MQGDRHREIAYHDLERLDDDQLLAGRSRDGDAAWSPSRDRAHVRPAAQTSGRVTTRGGPPEHFLTEIERLERWPIG